MAKVGIYRIGFASQSELNDSWSVAQQQQNQPVIKGQPTQNELLTVKWFSSIDQTQASLTERLVTDENGMHYETTLNFTVRKDSDIALAKKWMKRPLKMYVDAVDRTCYTLGTKQYPVWMQPTNTYDGIDTREINIEVVYRTINGILSK